MRFEPGLQKFEPDLEKVKENIRESTSEKIQEQEGYIYRGVPHIFVHYPFIHGTVGLEQQKEPSPRDWRHQDSWCLQKR